MNTQIANIRNQRGDITTDSKDIKRIRKYYDQCYANKLDMLDEEDTDYQSSLKK